MITQNSICEIGEAEELKSKFVVAVTDILLTQIE